MFVPILSRAAINNKKIKNYNYNNLTIKSSCDFLLLQHRYALELYHLGFIENIYPLFVGDFDDGIIIVVIYVFATIIAIIIIILLLLFLVL